jgi:hypothetical protein
VVTADLVKIKVPWFVLVLVAVVVIGSAIGATASIGPSHGALGLPAVLTYAIPVAVHVASAFGAWERARSTDLSLRRATRQGLIGSALILMIAAALVTQLRLGHLDVVAMAIIGLVSGAGPLILALMFFRP